MQRLRYQEEAETRTSYLKQVVFYILFFTLFHILLVLPPLRQIDTVIISGLYGLVSFFVLVQLGKNSHLSFGQWNQEPLQFKYLYSFSGVLFGLALITGLLNIGVIKWVSVGLLFSSSFYIGVQIGRAETLEKELAAEDSRSEAYSSKIIDAIIQRDISKARTLTNQELERGRRILKEYNRESILRSDALSLVFFLISIATLTPLLGVFGALGTGAGFAYVINKVYITYSEVNRLENREIQMDVRKWRKQKVREDLKKDQQKRRDETHNKKN